MTFKPAILLALSCTGSAYSLPSVKGVRGAMRARGGVNPHQVSGQSPFVVPAATPVTSSGEGEEESAPAGLEVTGGATGEPGGKLVLLGAVVMLFVSVHRTMFSVGIVPIQEQLGLSGSTVGLLQSAYLVGYALTNGPGGAIADKLGGAPVMLSCLAAWSLTVLLMPVAAASAAPVAALTALRVIFGLASGPALPSALAVVSQWLPQAKRSSGIADIFVFFNAGSAVGLLFGGLIPVLGWQKLMVLGGLAGLAWGGGGLALANKIAAENERPKDDAKGADAAPAASSGGGFSVGQIVQLAALTHVHNAINWSFFFMQAWLPAYFSKQLGLELSKSAGLSALPMITMAVGSKVAGQTAVGLIQDKGWKPFKVRRLMIAVSSLIPAVSLLALGGVTDANVAVGLLVVALGAHSFSSAGYHSHISDVAPSASGKILGFTNTVGVFVGIVANIVTGRVLEATGSFKACFALTAAIYLSEFLAFFGLVKGGRLL